MQKPSSGFGYVVCLLLRGVLKWTQNQIRMLILIVLQICYSVYLKRSSKHIYSLMEGT